MKPACIASLALALALASSACGRSDAVDAPATAARGESGAAAHSASAPGMPGAPERYRRGLDRACAAAGEGSDPTMPCNGVVARAAGNATPAQTPHPEAVTAFELCYVEARVRYIETLLAGIGPGAANANDDCDRIIATQRISRARVGTFATNIRLEIAELDRRLLDRVGAALQAKCPTYADLFVAQP